VDLQVRGYLGVSFSDPSVGVETMADACHVYLHESGCCGILLALGPLIGSSREYEAMLERLASLCVRPDLQDRVLGIHLLMPFGALPRRQMGDALPILPDVTLWRRLQRAARGHIKLIAVSPERRGAAALIAAAGKDGVACSLVPYGATREEVQEALEAAGGGSPRRRGGIRMVSDVAGESSVAGIKPWDHPIWAVIGDESVHAGYVPPRSTREGADAGAEKAAMTVVRARGVVLSDSTAAEAEERHMLSCLNEIQQRGECSTEELLAMGCDAPLAVLGLSRADVRPRDAEGLLSFNRHEGFSVPDWRFAA